jgi:hypothetical protein
MKKACVACAYFKQEWTEDVNDGWCKCDYDHFDEDYNPEPHRVWCSEWKSEKKWGDIIRRNGEIQELKAMMRRIASLLATGNLNNLEFALKVAKQYGGEA